ncbi:hypothetical protein RA27_17140 [Ruegeria sp. ANG-R]|uniref:hypothetical protein n=1 Tax=Ruegeria sp. ANG-R TaxID=1577903 RepID=UPI00057C60BF|nr:hypothetical protein [Ruegeria sp. ANG-R]KIC39790.1 hypothetical protein RA27_17140 [Ruegeria sp. ANG-R]
MFLELQRINNSMRIFKYLGFIAILTGLALLEQCSTIDVSNPEAFRSSRLSNAPLLSQVKGSNNYEFHFIAGTRHPTITFHPNGSFYLVSEGIDTSTGTTTIHRYDAAGRRTDSMELPEDAELVPFSHYVVSPEFVYDLSQRSFNASPVLEILNNEETRVLTQSSWGKYIEKFAQDAEVILHANSIHYYDRQASFIKIHGSWLRFHTPRRSAEIKTNWDYDVRISGFPDRFDRAIPLKAVGAPEFALGYYDGTHKEPDHYPDPQNDKAINFLRFDKTSYITYAYSYIPSYLIGTAFYELDINGDAILFKEKSARPSTAFDHLESISVFQPPPKFPNADDIRFLLFHPFCSCASEGSDGLYLIRPRNLNEVGF